MIRPSQMHRLIWVLRLKLVGYVAFLMVDQGPSEFLTRPVLFTILAKLNGKCLEL